MLGDLEYQKKIVLDQRLENKFYLITGMDKFSNGMIEIRKVRVNDSIGKKDIWERVKFDIKFLHNLIIELQDLESEVGRMLGK